MPPVRRYAGFGNEATFGTAVPAAFHVDMQSASLDSPTGTELYYGGGLGRGIRTRRPGYYRPGGNVVYAWDIRTITHMLRWALAGYVFTANVPPPQNTHKIYASDESILPSFTARIGKDVFEHVFAGCVVDSLELDLASDFLLATMAVSAQKDSKATLQAESALLLPVEFPLAFHEVTLELPTLTDLSADVRALKLSISNGLRGDAGRGIGSRFPRRLPAGERQIDLGLDLWFESTVQLERFWGGATGPANAGATDFTAKILASAGADGSLAIDIPSAHFGQVQLQPSGRDELVQSTEVRTLVDDNPLSTTAITSSSIANPTVITTAAAHGLVTGDRVTIAGHTGSTPAINGTHKVTVLTGTTFTIPVNVTAAGTGGTVAKLVRSELLVTVVNAEPDVSL